LLATSITSSLSLHDALPISSVFGHTGASHLTGVRHGTKNHQNLLQKFFYAVLNSDLGGISRSWVRGVFRGVKFGAADGTVRKPPDRKSTRLNSSHVKISYAV